MREFHGHVLVLSGVKVALFALHVVSVWAALLLCLESAVAPSAISVTPEHVVLDEEDS